VSDTLLAAKVPSLNNGVNSSSDNVIVPDGEEQAVDSSASDDEQGWDVAVNATSANNSATGQDPAAQSGNLLNAAANNLQSGGLSFLQPGQDPEQAREQAELQAENQYLPGGLSDNSNINGGIVPSAPTTYNPFAATQTNIPGYTNPVFTSTGTLSVVG